jgi:hypothetical protein
MIGGDRFLSIVALVAGFGLCVLAVGAVAVPMSLLVVVPASLVGTSAAWLGARYFLVGMHTNQVFLIKKQLIVRLVIATLDPLCATLGILVGARPLSVPREGVVMYILGAATTFASKREDVSGSLFGALAWLTVSLPLEEVVAARSDGATTKRGRLIAAFISWGAAFLLAMAVAVALYR